MQISRLLILEEIEKLLLAKLEPYTRNVEFFSAIYDELIIRVDSLEKENKLLKDKNAKLKNQILVNVQDLKVEDNAIK